MTSLFMPPKTPEPVDRTIVNTGAEERAEAERKRRLLASGRSSTILGSRSTGPLGSLRKSLLGG